MSEQSTKNHRRLIVFLVAVNLILSAIAIYGILPRRSSDKVPSKGEARFVVSSWDYPDQYGQGIYGVGFYENSTGSWLAAPYYTHYYPDYHEELGEFYFLAPSQNSYILNWSAGVAMKLRVYSVLNTTLVGISEGDYAEGENYLQHNVTVTDAGTIVFSQQNFTYYGNTYVSGDLIPYQYDVILNFIPASGHIYTATVLYEIYFGV